jgi:hypothetical protein
MGAFFCDECRTPCCYHVFPCYDVILGGDSHHMNVWKDSLDAPGGFHPAYTRHLHVHDDDVRNEMECHLDSRVPVSRLPYNGETNYLFKKSA